MSPVSMAFGPWSCGVLAFVCGRAPPPVLRAFFSIFRVKVYRGGVYVVVAVPRGIRYPDFNPISTGTSRGLFEWCGLERYCLLSCTNVSKGTCLKK
jgi:hypothetical protein